MKFRNILLPVDFSERCRAVAPRVNAVARRDNAALTLLHVLDTAFLAYGMGEASCACDISLRHMIEEAEHRLTYFAAELFPGMQTNLLVQEGDPGYCIAETARESGIDMIMMATRGNGKLRAALLGSVAAKVLHDAECPVWTSAHGEMPADGPELGAWRRITCGIDTTDDAIRIVRHARELHESYGSAIHLVHAVPAAAEVVPERYFDRDFEVFLKDSARKTIADIQAKAGTNFKVCVEGGKIASVMAFVAEEDKADLVLIGRGALAHFAGRLRTHAYGIIRDVPCPVLSV